MNNKQEQLREFYKTKFFKNADISDNYSSPHLISLENEKINTDIMIIGQETNSWYGSYQDFRQRGVESQMKIYSCFMDEKYETMNTLFWRWTKNIINSETIPVWTNLFKFDLGDNAKHKNISKANKEEYDSIVEFHQGILEKEIEIIKPKVIIFFTGNPYDKLFFDPIVIQDGDYRELYQSVDSLEGVNEWKCAILNLNKFDGFKNFEGKAIRTYHPMYLNRQYKKFGQKVEDYLKIEVNAIYKRCGI